MAGQDFPYLIGGQFCDRAVNEGAGKLRVWGEIGIGQIHPPVDGGASGLAFVQPHTQHHDGGAAAGNEIQNVPTGGLDLQAISTPAHGLVGGGIAAPDEIDPEGLLDVRVSAGDGDGQTQVRRCDRDGILALLEMRHHQWAFHQRVVRNQMHRARASRWLDRQQRFENGVGDKGAVLAARVTNNPGVGLRGGEIFVANIGDDRAELLYRVAIIFGCWLLAAGCWLLAAIAQVHGCSDRKRVASLPRHHTTDGVSG
ncbi:MAG: hypothetical protein Q8O33_11275 [Pseudomonadota bacterium]|nr:hypothetical protein [Pseudomonadota bacterium]